jgi:hypothetical protein
MVVHSSSEAPRLPEASAFERAAGTTSHPKQSATKVDHGLAVETRLQKLADPNACDPKTAAAAAAATATSAAAAMAAPSTVAAASSATASSATTSSAQPPWPHPPCPAATRTLRAPAISLSKTKKVAKLTSEISSSEPNGGELFYESAGSWEI